MISFRFRFVPGFFGFCLGGIFLPVCGADAPVAADAAFAVSGEPLLSAWVPPVYPVAARAAKQEGRVIVDMLVDEHGVVTEARVAHSDNAVFDEAALAAVRQWRFKPGLDEGKPVPFGLVGPVEFQLAPKTKIAPGALPPERVWPHPAKRRAAKIVSAVDPDYPEELDPRKLPGRVDLRIQLGADGKIAGTRVLWASHAAFVAEALRVSRTWTFEPARQGLLALGSEMEAPAEFVSVGAKRAEMLAANGIRVVDAEPEVLPEPFVITEPVYPLEKLLAGEEGTAEAAFTVDARGVATALALTSCSAPEFGAALVAAVDGWTFRPAMQGGARVPVKLAVTWSFARPTEGALKRLAEALAPGGEGVPSAKGLDRPLAVVWRGFPVYPSALVESAAEGKADIEFIIDRDGRARLPRVLAATQPEFGWAAATAVSQWVFEPPQRGGEAVAVRVQIPIGFTPPQK
ncbi:MAG: TonB family protein [Candidatus Didemnitutus sp.]|nr:TonB family protein [Candidatus Didemnitutus sp.]